MASTGDISDTGESVNWLLLAELVAVVIAASAFLFYWNRLFGSVFAFLIRLIAWRKYNAYITVGSLQISPLAGRVAFRNVEYHSSNLSVRVLNGHITWRYWKLRVKQEDDEKSANVKRNRLPCRITVYTQGVEAFLHNRTPAYEAIIERMKKHEEDEKASHKFESTSSDTTAHDLGKHARLRKSANITTAPSSRNSSEDNPLKTAETENLPYQPKSGIANDTIQVNWFREALPIDIHIHTGSIVLGNDATPMVMIGEFKGAEATLSICDAKSRFDHYKLSVDVKFRNPVVLMRTNVDYSGPVLAHGKKAYDKIIEEAPDTADQPPSTFLSSFGFRLLSRRFPFLHDPKFSTPPAAGLPQDRVWKGLARYRNLGGNEPKRVHREDREYAKVATILEAPALDLTYYSDTPGVVPLLRETDRVDASDKFGNIDAAPEYGIDIVIHGGIVKYGPWADRQRDAFQKVFAPSIFFDSEFKARLQPGDTRVHTQIVLNILLSEETILRIPTREPSKDWLFDGSSVNVERRYGWLDVTVGANSSVLYTQAQVATSSGYDTLLVLHLDSVQMASSVNLETFLSSKTCKVSMSMPTPLAWDAEREWGLDIALESSDINLLRDHVTLISDVAKDWSSGSLGDFHHFVPNRYNFRVSLINYAIHLCVNDYNIIDRPRSREDNAFVDFYGSRLDAYVAVAATQYRPEFSVIPFTVKANDVRVELGVPKWDTHRAFGSGNTLEIGKIGQLTASGSYRYYSDPRPDHQETMTLHLEGKGVIFKALGWVLRRLFCVKDNYFGGFTQFTTMQEYLERFDHDPSSVGDPVEGKYRPGKSDPFVVVVTMNVEDSLIMMSDEVFNCERGLVMPVPQLQMALKSAEHHMGELSLDAQPTYVVTSADLAQVYESAAAPTFSSREALFIEGIEVKANRLFGPEPRANTYLCLWEASIPKISAFLSPTFLATLKSAMGAVAYNYTDIDNAPARMFEPKSLPDVTFFKLSIGHVTAALFSGKSAISVTFPAGIILDTSTLASSACSSTVGVCIPAIDAAILVQLAASSKWTPLGNISTTLDLDVFKTTKDWEIKASEQQIYLKREDAATQRIPYMYRDRSEHRTGNHVLDVYLPQPRGTDEFWSSSDSDNEHEVSESDLPDGGQTSSPDTSEGETSGSRNRYRHRHSTRPLSTLTGRPRSSLSTSRSSVSDSSDSASFDHSYNGTSVWPTMAAALATRLQEFRSHKLHQDKEQKESPHLAEGVNSPAQSNRSYGSVLRLRLSSLSVDVCERAVVSVQGLANTLQAESGTRERQLDSMMIQQADAALATGDVVGMTLLDGVIPTIKLRLRISNPNRTEDAAIDMDMANTAVMFSKQTSQNGKTAFGGKCSTGTAQVIASSSMVPSGDISLREVRTSLMFRETLVPVAGMDFNAFAAEYTQHSRKRILHVRCDVLDLDCITSAVSLMSSFVDTWQAALETVPSRGEDTSAAVLLYETLHQAATAGVSHLYPPFVYEGAYGLHVEDQRNIRRDVGWMILARLRYWLRSMEADMTTEVASTKDMARFVVEHIRYAMEDVGGNEDLIYRQTFLRMAFKAEFLSMKHKEEDSYPTATSLLVYLNSLVARHHGRLLEQPSIVASSIRIQSSSVGLQHTSSSQDGISSSHIRATIASKCLGIEIENSLVSALRLAMAAIDSGPKTSPVEVINEPLKPDHNALWTLSGHLESTHLTVIAGGLKVRLDGRNWESNAVQRTHHGFHRDTKGSSASSSLNTRLQNLEITLFQPQDEHDLISNSIDRAVLSHKVQEVKIVVVSTPPRRSMSDPSLKLLFSIQKLEFESRPQLRAFSTFIQGWYATNYPHYKPAIDQFVTTLNRQPAKASSTPSRVHTQVDISIGSIHLQVRAAKALWLHWDVGSVYLTRQGPNDDYTFGIKLSPQVVGAYTAVRKSKSRGNSSLRLPSIIALGTSGERDGVTTLSASLDVGFLVGVLKPAVLDRLLSLHQQLGSDMMNTIKDCGAMLRKTSDARSDQGFRTVADTLSDSKIRSTAVNLRFSLSGIRLGLKADDVAATLLFEALAMNGHIESHTVDTASLSWRVKAERVGLSLGHVGSMSLNEKHDTARRHRSAYMVIDMDVQEIPASADIPSRLNAYLSRAHMVMHIAALSELSDLVRSWQGDLHTLRDNRSAEVAEVKEQTRKVLQKLDTTDRQPEAEISWFASRLLTVELTGLGVAIPLDDNASIDLSRESQLPGSALLFSIRVISFQNKRNETARFRIQQMTLQFVEEFDQRNAEHFKGDYHPSCTRMSLPSLDSEAQMSSVPEVWTLSAHCSATDFRLSLAPDVADGVFKLLDLYRRGKDRVSELERHYRIEMASEETAGQVLPENEEIKAKSLRRNQRIAIRMSFTFNSGIVDLFKSTGEAQRRILRASAKTATPRAASHDTFTLPTISLWVDYAGPHSANNDIGAEPGCLIVNSAVHSSRNIINPSILPFFAELANRIEQVAKNKNAEIRDIPNKTDRPELPVSNTTESKLQRIAVAPRDKIFFRFTLRIDKSELRLSCAPDSNAFVDLRWESGGFLVSTTLGSEGVSSVIGSISGVKASLSHEFAEEGRSCIEASAKDLAFSVTLCPGAIDNVQKGLSVVLDTQLSAEFRLEAFSAWLIFTSVWIDNAPKLDLPLRTAIPEAAASPPLPVAHDQPKMAVAVIARLRSVDFNANISVSRAKLELTPIILRTLSNGERTEIDLRIGTTSITARGDISGDLCSESLVFSTIRRSSRASASSDPTVLSMSIDAGDLSGNLFLGDTNIVRFHLDPALVTLADDWRAFTADPTAQVFLFFVVKTGHFQGVVRLLAIPRLLGNLYSIFDITDSQTRIAAQRSDIFKANQLRKSTEPSPVATVIMQNAKKAGASALDSTSVKTAQVIRFDLSGIDIGVFNEDYEDGQISDFYRFVVGKVEADLKRQLTKDHLPRRDLSLLVALVRWDSSNGSRTAAKETKEITARELIDLSERYGRREVASLPQMTLSMGSTEYPDPATIEYDFNLVWGETDGDVAILPNFFEQAYRAFRKLIAGLDEQQLARERRLGTSADFTSVLKETTSIDLAPHAALHYRPREIGNSRSLPIPRLKPLGEGTTEAARLIPKITEAVNELPVMSHRFVTLPLEEGMDLLLKLYEKQLPDRVSADGLTTAATDLGGLNGGMT